MHLYLSSYHFGAQAQKFAELVRGQKRVGIIPNALDFSEDLPRLQKSFQREVDDLSLLGLSAEMLDLRRYFGHQQRLQTKMEALDAVWVVGGNTFILRRAMAESGLDHILKEMVTKKTRPNFVYAGYSAGACVLPKTLNGLDLADDPNFLPTGYKNHTLWDGLNILSYSIAPHYRSNHFESALVDKLVEFYKKQKMPFKALRDGEDLIERV